MKKKHGLYQYGNIKIKNRKFRTSLSLDKKTVKQRYKIMYSETFHTSPAGSSAQVIFQSKNYLKNKTVLDLGCGAGRVSLYAAKYAKHVTGIDYIEKAITYAQKFAKLCNIKNVDFSVGDLDTFKGEKFDVIMMTEVFQHIDNPLCTLKRSRKMLNKNGHVIISVPSYDNFRGMIWLSLQKLFGLPMSLTDTYQISADEIESMCKKSGFKMEKIVGAAMDWAWTEWGIEDMKRRIMLATKDAKLEQIADFKSMNNWLDSLLIFNKQFLQYMIDKKIVKKRPLLKLSKFSKKIDAKTKKYLDDGNTKVNRYYCDVSPFNRMGEDAIYILKVK